jgi:hypothetical protein
VCRENGQLLARAAARSGHLRKPADDLPDGIRDISHFPVGQKGGASDLLQDDFDDGNIITDVTIGSSVNDPHPPEPKIEAGDPAR